MFCDCLHSVDSHHVDGCHVPTRDASGVLKKCYCRRSRDRVLEGPDRLKDALALAAARARRRNGG